MRDYKTEKLFVNQLESSLAIMNNDIPADQIDTMP